MDAMIPLERIEQKIFFIRGKKVMLDRDLAELYGVKTKVLNQAVRRNQGRFPEDFMFVLKVEEKNELVTICDRLERLKHSSVLPNAFTENGVAMLSSVLNSERAVQVNIQIMRAFIKLRELNDSQRHIFTQLNKHEIKLLQHDKQIAGVFQTLDSMREKEKPTAKRKLGFVPPEEI